MSLAAVPLGEKPDRSASPEVSFQDELRFCIDNNLALWENAGTQLPLLRTRYEARQQRENERKFDLLIRLVENHFRGVPDAASEQEAWRQNVLAMVRQVCTKSLGLPETYLNILLSKDYIEVTKTFVRQAREFDRDLELSDLGQAMRNVWVANYLQMLLGRQPSFRPAIFAYSMLYPYSDNYLDGPQNSAHSKAAFNQRFGERLRGVKLLPLNCLERQVFRLVEIIEGDYPRSGFPEVYQSLLAIHRGQIRSLQQQGAAQPLDLGQLLRISVEKGGTSVLADGYLIDGMLTREEAEFFFGFGVLLQLQDDLQDLQPDRESQRWTIFSRTSIDTRLDELTSRLYHFMEAVLKTSARFSDPRNSLLRELIGDNCFILMLQSIAINCADYSRGYLRHMELYSPLRFGYLSNLRPRLEKKGARVMDSLKRRSTPLTVFDLLG
jgi:hypothetical protein